MGLAVTESLANLHRIPSLSEPCRYPFLSDVRYLDGLWFRLSPQGICLVLGHVRYSRRLERVTATKAFLDSSSCSLLVLAL